MIGTIYTIKLPLLVALVVFQLLFESILYC